VKAQSVVDAPLPAGRFRQDANNALLLGGTSFGGALPRKDGHEMARDPVCGMHVDPMKAAGTSEHQGKTYVFCSVGCKRKFDSNPAQYTSK
jgi:YHS domain-containing protein